MNIASIKNHFVIEQNEPVQSQSIDNQANEVVQTNSGLIPKEVLQKSLNEFFNFIKK